MKQTTFVIAALALLFAAPAASRAQGISVVIDNRPVAFSGTPPMERNGSVLVPLRGVFEALGASVNYNGATKTIQATKGSTNVILILGQTTAYVNNAPQALSQPADVIGGTTLVPLRFVAQAFGAAVSWLAPTRTVDIHTAGSDTTAGGGTTTATGEVTGVLSAVHLDTNPPQIIVNVNGAAVSVPVSGDTLVLMQSGTSAATQSTLEQLAVGDPVRVTRSAAGGASIVRVSYAEHKGAVSNVAKLNNGSYVVTLEGGDNILLPAGSKVLMNGKAMSLADIKAGQSLSIRTDTAGSQVYGVSIVSAGTGTTGTGTTGTGPASVTINSFTVDSTATLKRGGKLEATLIGTPKASAAFNVPGVVDTVAMIETTPGVYKGSYVIPVNVNVEGGAVIGRLTGAAGSTPVLIQAAKTITVDSTPPIIRGQSPAPDSQVSNGRPRIYAVLEDPNGTGIDTAGTHLAVDGREITPAAIVTENFVTYQPGSALSEGLHKIILTTRDIAGNYRQSDWSFTVAANQGLITNFKSNLSGTNPRVGAGEQVKVTMNAQPGGTAMFSIGSVATNIKMVELSPGVYTGSFTPAAAGSNVSNAPIVGRFRSKNGTEVTSTLDQPVTIAAGAPGAPVILTPREGDTVPGKVTITGTALAGTQVSVTVTYSSPGLGGLFRTSGKAAETQVTTDANGRWTTGELQLASGGFLATSKGTTYAITAVTVDATGKESEATTVNISQQ